MAAPLMQHAFCGCSFAGSPPAFRAAQQLRVSPLHTFRPVMRPSAQQFPNKNTPTQSSAVKLTRLMLSFVRCMAYLSLKLQGCSKYFFG